ncbi:MAG: nicotinate-nucleotide adenylyltransferase [Firmicutes bacterium]|nr:nicotinate-nucleotide adenylyltransferase [Bacillota bacterium]
MNKSIKRLGIMGGTFDPIHYGHLVTAEAARGEYELDHVLFLPSGISPHKDPKTISDAQHRYLMTVFATLTNPYFEVSRVEIDREGVTYTIDTLRLLKEQYGADTKLYFITGADVIAEIMSWKDSSELIQLSEFIAATRPGFKFQPEYVDQWFFQQNKHLHQLKVPAMAISSTDIRLRVKAGKSIRYLVPESVEYYIRKNKLYIDKSDTQSEKNEAESVL